MDGLDKEELDELRENIKDMIDNGYDDVEEFLNDKLFDRVRDKFEDEDRE